MTKKLCEVFTYITIVLLTACCSVKQQTPRDSGNAKLIRKADSMFVKGTGIDLFIQKNNSSLPEKVKDTLNWPYDNGIIYNVLKGGNNIALVKIIPLSESGDFNLVSSYYLDSKKEVFAIIRVVSYFNEPCSEDIVIEKKYFEWNSKTFFLKEYSLTNKSGHKLDSSNCKFGDYPNTILYRKLSEMPISKVLN